MNPLVRAAVIVAMLSAVSAFAESGAKLRQRKVVRMVTPGGADDMSTLCPKGWLPDVDHCVPIPDSVELSSGEELLGERNAHRERDGSVRVYEQIPRSPDRPSDYSVYRYPIPAPPDGKLLMSGYDLDKPDSEQRRGAGLSAVGHGGIDLAQVRGAPVSSLAFEHQEGDSEVIFVGKLFGNTVATRHRLREGGRLRDYVAIHGHLDAAATGLKVGMAVREGELLGYVGDSGSEGIIHLHYEIRQLRDGIDVSVVRSKSLALPNVSIACDPRNVLPLQVREEAETKH